MTNTKRDGKWEYTIRAYRPPNLGGGLLMETVHIGTASRDAEIAAWRARLKTGGIAYIEVIAHIDPFDTIRIYQ